MAKSMLADVGAAPAARPLPRQIPATDLLALFDTDPDNPESDAVTVQFVDGQVAGPLPPELTDAQRKMVELARRWVPRTGTVTLTQTALAAMLQQIRCQASPTGSVASTIPMICSGPFCPLVQDGATAAATQAAAMGAAPSAVQPDLSRCRCPLYRSGINPISRPCPLERINAQVLRDGLVESLGIEPTQLIHTHLVEELVVFTVLRARVLAELAADPESTILQEAGAVGKITDARILHRREADPRFDILDRLQERIDKLRKQLMATPEMEFKLRGKDDTPARPVIPQIRKSQASGISTVSHETLTGGGEP